MTKKDYVAIAGILAGLRARSAPRSREDEVRLTTISAVVEIATMQMADHMQRDNPRFNRALFLRACGVAQ
jgi:hypothetical protein